MLRPSDVLKIMESLAPGQRAIWQLSITFNSDFVVVTLDPAKHEGAGRRYTLHLGDTLEKALAIRPFMHGRRGTTLSNWISERNPVLIEGPAPVRRAA